MAFKGVIRNLPTDAERRIVIEGWNGELWAQLGAIKADEKNAFSATLEAPDPGQYRLRFYNQRVIITEFIISEETQNLTFTLDYSNLGGTARPEDSPENLRYAELQDARRSLYRIADAQPEKLDSTWLAFNRFCYQTTQEFPKSFVAVAACLFREAHPFEFPQEPDLTAAMLLRKHGLDGLPFNDQRILHHSAFADALDRYGLAFDTTDADRLAFIDSIMAHRKSNEEVNAYLFKFLLRKMLDEFREPAIAHLVSVYPPDCSEESPLPSGVKWLIDALSQTTSGNPAPQLVLADVNGEAKTLQDLTSKNKLTLLMFWRTACPHCQEFEPVLKKLYSRYKAQGFEVFAVSLDRNPEEWRSFLQEHQLPWIQTMVPWEMREPVLRKFPVASTPTLMLIGQDGKMINRMVSRGEIERLIARYFN